MSEKPKAITMSEVEAPMPEKREHPPAITTDKVFAAQPAYPTDETRRPAKGPMITTGNIEEIRRQYVETETNTAPVTEAEPKTKKGRAQKG